MEYESGSGIGPDRQFNYLLFGILGTLGIIILYFSGGFFLEDSLNELLPGLTTGLISSIIQILLMLVPAIIAMKLTPTGISGLLMLGSDKNKQSCIIAIIGLFPLIVFIAGYSYLQDIYIAPSFQPYYDKIENLIDNAYKKIILIDGPTGIYQAIFFTAIVPAISEEILFRGFLFGALLQKLKPRTVIIISSVVFALVHFNPISLIPLLMIGTYLGISVYYTKSIMVPIIIHFINNLISVTALYNPALEEIDKNPGDIPLVYILVSMIVSLGLIIFIFRRLFIQRNTKNEGAGFELPSE